LDIGFLLGAFYGIWYARKQIVKGSYRRKR
jgi:hypothetical protein